MRALTMIFGSGKQHPVDLFPMLHSWQLNHALKSAKRADHAPEKKYSGASLEPYEYAHFSWGPQADGVWACCCGKENELIHYKGAYPFKYLRCERCNHHPCGTCRKAVRGVLRPLTRKDIAGPVLIKPDVQYCTICFSCGLSYRATKHKGEIIFPQKCHCGDSFRHNSMRYRIRPADEYRRNPVKAAHKAKSTLLKAKTENVSNIAEANRERRIENEQSYADQARQRNLTECFDKLLSMDNVGLQMARAQLEQLHDVRRNEDFHMQEETEQEVYRAAYRSRNDDSSYLAQPPQDVHRPPASYGSHATPLRRTLTSIDRGSSPTLDANKSSIQRRGTRRLTLDILRSATSSGRTMQPHHRPSAPAIHHAATQTSQEQSRRPLYRIGVAQRTGDARNDYGT